jgi:hypothetical protein
MAVGRAEHLQDGSFVGARRHQLVLAFEDDDEARAAIGAPARELDRRPNGVAQVGEAAAKSGQGDFWLRPWGFEDDGRHVKS